MWCLFLLLAAEDDPDDADFEPDYGVTSSRTANKVQIFCIILINYIWSISWISFFLIVAHSTRFR